MIFTITFNPALDVNGIVPRLIADEKNYVSHEIHRPGGNGINAGIIASRLGSPVTLMGFLGGPNGQETSDLLRDEEVRQDFISIRGNTRMNITVSHESDHRQTRLSFPGPAVLRKELAVLRAQLSRVTPDDLVIIGGSLPQGISSADVAELVRQLVRKKVQVIVDCPGTVLKAVLLEGPLLIKPNLTEFQELTGPRVRTISSVIKRSRAFLPVGSYACVSSVEGGALLVSHQRAWFGKIPSVKIRSTVGAGDSMVGAMATLLHRDPDTPGEELLRTGLAASAATLSEKGCSLGRARTMRRLVPLVRITAVAEK